MSLPSSERLPNDINDLPPARQRHIRRQPRSVSLAERQILLDSLVRLTAPTPSFFGRAFLGALATGLAFYLFDPAILIIAIVVLPFSTPLFGLALYPITLNGRHALKSLISLTILLTLTFGAGILAGWLRTTLYPDPLSIYRFSALYWLYLAVLGASAVLSATVLFRQGQIPQGLGVLLSYTLLAPFAVVGFGLTSGQSQLWTGALFVSFAHLGLAFVLAVLSFLSLGFPPKKAMGWLVTIVFLMMTLAVMSASLNLTSSQPVNPQVLPPSPTRLVISSPTPPPKASATLTATPAATSEMTTATQTSSPAPSNTSTPSPEPTTSWGVVKSDIGAVIRESPGFDSLVVGYANDGDLVEILGEETPQGNTRWFQVRTESGVVGWLLGSLVNTETPAPTPEE